MDIPGFDDHDHAHSHDEAGMEEELRRAAQEGRQPICIYCHQPLQVAQRVEEQIIWYWNPESKAYEKMRLLVDTLDKPYCTSCNTPDEHFTRNSWFQL